jgi:hypothetical protein
VPAGTAVFTAAADSATFGPSQRARRAVRTGKVEDGAVRLACHGGPSA